MPPVPKGSGLDQSGGGRRFFLGESLIASIARRYARASLDLCTGIPEADLVSAGLVCLQGAIEASDDLQNILFNPAFDRGQRHLVIDRVATALNLGPTLKNLAGLLVDRHRFDQLGAISRSFRELADERAGRAQATVITAAPLAPELASKLQGVLSLAVARHVTIETRIDPSMLGGVVAQVGTFLFDGSIKSQLERLRRELTLS